MLGPLYRLADLARNRGRRRTWDSDLAAGRRGEDIAHRFLQRAGMTVVARNHRTPSGSGEVDLVAWDAGRLVFIEVKARSSNEFGPPERAVDGDKQHRLILAAADYARRAEVPLSQVRFDVVSVVLAQPPVVTHFREVFTAQSAVYRN